MAATDAIPVPQKNVAYRVTFPINDSSGDPATGAASLDSEVSKDGGAFSDATNEASEIGQGLYSLDLTSTEMNADTVVVVVKSDQKQTSVVIYPEEAGDIRVNVTQIEGSDATDQIRDALVDDATRFSGADIAAILTDTAEIANLNDPTSADIADAVWDEVITGAQHNVNTSAAKFLREASETIAIRTGTAQAGGNTSITLDANASSTDDIYVGERATIIENTGAGQARLIVDYNGTTKVATVDRDWHVNPDNTSVFAITPADSDLRTIAADAQSVTDLKDFADEGYDPSTNNARSNVKRVNDVVVTGTGSEGDEWGP